MSAPAAERQQQQALPRQSQLPATAPTNSQDAIAKVIEYVPLGANAPIKLSGNIIRLVLNPRTRSGVVADDQQILKFILLCKARNLDPFEGDAYLLGYDGKDGPEWSIITSIYAFLKRAEVCSDYEGKESGVIVQRMPDGSVEDRIGDFICDDEKLLGGWCKVYRKGRRYPEVKRVELKRYHTGRSRWQADPGGMICKVAEMQALRDTFPSVLGGLYAAEEMGGLPYQAPAQSVPALTHERPPSLTDRVRGNGTNGTNGATATAPARPVQQAETPVQPPAQAEVSAPAQAEKKSGPAATAAAVKKLQARAEANGCDESRILQHYGLKLWSALPPVAHGECLALIEAKDQRFMPLPITETLADEIQEQLERTNLSTEEILTVTDGLLLTALNMIQGKAVLAKLRAMESRGDAAE